jgi:rhodanese-related sulfurtransferase
MRALEARWQSALFEGKVKSVTPAQTAALMREGWLLLDVRPPGQTARVRVTGAVAVPLFVEDASPDLAGVLRRASALAMGGWWLGGTHMAANPRFMAQVLEAVPTDARVIVACQKGLRCAESGRRRPHRAPARSLPPCPPGGCPPNAHTAAGADGALSPSPPPPPLRRSLAAAEQLSRAGYARLGWINGGFDCAKAGDGLATEDGRDIRYGGIGGVSELLGWTEVQQEEGLGGGVIGVLKLSAALLALDGLFFGASYLRDALLQGGRPP